MNAVISAILVGILRSVGWEKLILRVAEDMFYLVAKKVDVEAVKMISIRVADALKAVDEEK